MTPTDEPTLHPLDPAERRAVATLTTAFATLGVLRHAVAPSQARADVALDSFLPARPIVHAVAALADQLVDRWAPRVGAAASGDGALDEAEGAVTAALATALPAEVRTTIARLTEPPGRRHRGTGRGAGRGDARAEAGSLLHEAALERCDADLYLATDRTGGELVLWTGLPPASARVRLFESLYERLEVAVAAHELLALERLASRWAFERWSAPAPRDPETAFPRTVREQEWSLGERETLAFDAPAGRAVRDEAAVTLPPRQRALAAALAASTCGVHVVRERRGAVTVLEPVIDGTHRAPVIEMHEHNPELAYAAGFVALGRVIPDEAGRVLRSPGLAFVAPGDAAFPHTVADAVARSSETMPRALVVEAVLSGLFGTRPLPRDVTPATSPRAARELLTALHDALEAAGRVERVPASALPLRERAALLDAVGDRASEELHFERVDADDVVAEWMGALTALSRGLAPVRRGGRARGRRGR